MDWLLSRPRSRLLELPLELRDLIFEYALTSTKTVVTFRLDPYQEDSYAQAVQPALTKVSRQIRAESLPVWYGNNAFVLHTEATKAEQTVRWLRCNERHLDSLRRVEVWIRALVGVVHPRSVSAGAIGMEMQRTGIDSSWKVKERWRWITVCRRPDGIADDVEFLRARLGQVMAVSGPQGWAEVMKDVKLEYARWKTG